jgi:hypothetical protein
MYETVVTLGQDLHDLVAEPEEPDGPSELVYVQTTTQEDPQP